MRTIPTIRVLISLALAAILLAACAHQPVSPALYDLGPLPADISGVAPLPALTVADMKAPMWLDSQAMYFRLGYAGDRRPRPYAQSRWVMPPPALFGARLKSRLAQAGGVVLSTSDSASNMPALHIEMDDFIQVFAAPEQSSALLAVRASVFDGRALIAQKTFHQQAPAPSPDAAGGAAAFSMASDALITDMIAWLAQLPVRK